MTPEDDWNYFAPTRDMHPAAGMGSLRMALIFGTGAIVLALLIVPLAERRGGQEFAIGSEQLDRMSTGSISSGGSYTIRRSVLQADPNAICVIRPNGARSGDC